MRALCEFGEDGAQLADLIGLMVKQQECKLDGDTSTSRKYISQVLRSDDKMFIKVRDSGSGSPQRRFS